MPVRIAALIDPDVGPAGLRLVWLASGADGVPLGSAVLRLFTRTGQKHLAELQLHLQPEERPADTGFSLLDAAVASAREHHRRRVVTLVRAGSGGETLVTARGFHKVLTLNSGRLPLSDVDIEVLRAIIETPHAGYRLASWTGAVPDELMETFIASRHAMDDTPAGGIDFSAVPWDRDRVRAIAAAVAKRGDTLHTVVAISETDDAIAGFTELAIPGDGRTDAQHYGTAVLPEHRGHGLGRWMKAASIRYARERYPLLGGLLTDTADNNPHIRRINESLGYVPTHTTYEYQLDL